MQEPRAYACRVQFEIGDEARNPHRMRKIRLTTLAHLLTVRPLAVMVSPTNQVQVGVFVVITYLLQELVESGHLSIVRLDCNKASPRGYFHLRQTLIQSHQRRFELWSTAHG